MLHAAIDLGGSSGRVTVGELVNEKIVLTELHRFKHEPIQSNDGLFWDWQFILDQIKIGLNKACEMGQVETLGVDSWAVDYGLLDAKGELLAPPHCYRDGRTDGVMAKLKNELGVDYIYGKTGIQFIFFNTMYQLFVEKNSSIYGRADKFLMVPDLINYLLCGSISTEITNASTTQLLNVHTQDWDWELIEKLGIKKSLFAKINKPGEQVGQVVGHGKLDSIKVISVGSHDTASAVAGAPLGEDGLTAYISSGTWSLVGLELTKPVTDKKAMEFNITNEMGVADRIRFIKNVAGMWLLEESLDYWASKGEHYTAAELAKAAAELPKAAVIDANDPIFEKPGAMPERIAMLCEKSNQIVPQSPAAYARCIFDSLADAYVKVLAQLQSAAGVKINAINIVGGGSANRLLNQLTADATGVPVYAGPSEATVLGSILVQMQSVGLINSLAQGRSIIKNSITQVVFTPKK
ncbi:rhamnulokinase [Candidatus Nanopelagicus limnes]|uniref:Rhamnulokinase n=1 Tax=Candidatus Nanopelagicus limnae TaxID=1884634 RepID=A0A249JXE4_9ACTN|nr:rhamnulokinase family protein [Candidatus Nanopelagicus limnes]ASY09190.1 rhamnulokinase [Candidatus Nanopelagicus limnes]